MATIQSDPSLAGFNCYISLADANTYHDERLHNTAWTNSATSDKTKSLIWATRTLDTMKWRGVRTSGTQLLEFPRRGLSYYESSSIGGFDYERVDVEGLGYFTKIEISETAVPTFLKDATAELAMWLLNSDTTAPTGTEGFKRIKVDTIEVEMNPTDRQSWMNDSIRNLVWRFLASNSKYSGSTMRVG